MIAARVPEVRATAVKRTPRKNVSSMNATAKPDTTPPSTSGSNSPSSPGLICRTSSASSNATSGSIRPMPAAQPIPS